MNREEIAQERGFVPSTIISHLCELIEMNQPIDLNRIVPQKHHKPIIKAIQTVGADSLKSIYEHLQEKYSYEDIRLVRSWWRRENT